MAWWLEPEVLDVWNIDAIPGVGDPSELTPLLIFAILCTIAIVINRTYGRKSCQDHP